MYDTFDIPAEKRVEPRFGVRDDRPGLTVVDPLERRRYPLGTSDAVVPRPSPAEGFAAPVDSAVGITTDRVEFRSLVGAYVRSADTREVLLSVTHETETTLPEREYHVELTTPIKTYLHVTGELAVSTANDRLTLSFGAETEIRIGVRSRHSIPAATVTTTPDPTDVMAAVSTLGSALKTTSPERSFPTLRGHPPAVELGDELRVPDSVTRPDTGVRIEVPPEPSFIYPVAPLAYYLGAEVVPGEAPRIVTDETVHSLDHPRRGFEEEVECVLKRTFFLDCVTRTEGLYQLDLYEREAVDPLVDIDFATLYDRPLSERLAVHLDVPFSTLADHLPTWRLAVYATDDADSVELLPHVLADVPIVKMAASETRSDEAVTKTADIREFVRAAGTGTPSADDLPPNGTYVTPADVDTLERAWLGDGNPLGANKLLKAGFENRFDRERSVGDIDVTIVCNERRMRAEYDERALYGDREEVPFDVTVRHDLTTDELRTVLSEGCDFLHYIGHVDDEGFVCRDGTLAAAEVGSVGVDMFLLNACRSYELGIRLVEKGSIGGIVTYSDVGNAGATVIGRVVARLLNAGFALRSALTVARGRRLVGNQYVVVGDGSAELAQPENGTASTLLVDPLDDGFSLRIRTYSASPWTMGTSILPFIEGVGTNYLAGGDLPPFTVTDDELDRYFEFGDVPVISGGELFWSSDVDADRLS